MSDTTPDGPEPVSPTPPVPPADAPSAPAYEPPAPAYEAPAPPYDAPQAPPAYEPPPAPPYGTPAPPAYGAPAAPAYDPAAYPGYPPAAYGAPAAPAYGAYGEAQPKTNSLAVVSLISAIVGIFVIPFIGSIVAVITGHMSLSQIKRTGERGHGMGLAGTIVGWVGIGLSIIGIIIVIAWIGWFAANSPYMRFGIYQ